MGCAAAGLSAANNGTAHGLAHVSMGAPRVPDAFAAAAPAGPPAHLQQRHYGDDFQVLGCSALQHHELAVCLVARLLQRPCQLGTSAGRVPSRSHGCLLQAGQ